MAEQSGRKSRPALDREQVVRVALGLLDEVGLDDLTMRRLAERLGVSAASLYWHVRDKDELLTLLADAISGELPLPDVDLPWRDVLTASALAYRRVLGAHRDSARILVGTPPLGERRLRMIEALFSVLRRAGFALQDVADAGYLLNVYLMGFMLDEALSPKRPVADSRPATDTAPLGDLARGRLIVRHGTSPLTLGSEGGMAGLYRLACEEQPPLIEVDGGTVICGQRHGRHNACTLTLNAALLWDIEIQHGASRLRADLAGGRVASFTIGGGVSESTLHLPMPEGVVPVRIEGGVSGLLCERPAEAGMRVRVGRGANKLALDGMHLGSVGGETRWESANAATAPGCYDLEVSGGASKLTIGVAPGTDRGGGAPPASTVEAQVFNAFASQPDLFPTLALLARDLVASDASHRFAVGLEIFLDGLERRLARSSER